MNKKVSELSSAFVAAANDLLLIVQNSVTKNLTVEKLFGAINVPVNVKSTLNFGSIPDIVTSGAVPLDSSITHINLSSNQVLTLGAGSEGQVKYLVVVSGTGTATINTNLWGFNTLNFDAVGDTAYLLYTGGRWAFVSGTATFS